jgi:radical S-adenosyl methionine domain-containing protein 2
MIRIPELTINWHILEACNYDCYFCYAKYGQRSIFARQYSEVLRELGTLKRATAGSRRAMPYPTMRSS